MRADAQGTFGSLHKIAICVASFLREHQSSSTSILPAVVMGQYRIPSRRKRQVGAVRRAAVPLSPRQREEHDLHDDRQVELAEFIEYQGLRPLLVETA